MFDRSRFVLGVMEGKTSRGEVPPSIIVVGIMGGHEW